jgi:hypothetical protein
MQGVEKYVKVALYLQIGHEMYWEVHKYPPIKYPIITRGYKL